MNVKINQADIEAIGTLLSEVKNGVPRVLSTAINNTITNVRTDAVKRIGQKINLTATRIKKDFIDHKATYERISGSTEARGNPVGLISFSGTKTLAKGGVSVKVFKDADRVVLKHAFIAKGKGDPKDPDNPKMHVFERQFFKSRPYNPSINYGALRRVLGDKPYALPVERKTGPAVEDVYNRSEILNPVMEYASVRIDYNLNSRLDYELSKLK